MRIGVCVEPDQIEIVQAAGYDYIELNVGLVRPESPDSEFEAISELVYSSGITPEGWRCLLPGDLKVVGPDVDSYRVERYLRTAFDRIEDLGGEVVVFGSGGARNVPEGFPVDEARDQLMQFCKIAGQIAGAHGITVAVEPLNRGETNIINSIAEAVELTDAVDHPFVKVLVDLFHVMVENEPLSEIAGAAGKIVHAHIADSGRLGPGSGSYPTKEFIEALKATGYDDRLTIECSWGDFDSECVSSLAFLRSLTAD